MKSKETSVDWLKIKLPSLFEHDDNGFYEKLFKQAKQMEKEQILDSFDSARKFRMKNVFQYDLAKDYYNETYNP